MEAAPLSQKRTFLEKSTDRCFRQLYFLILSENLFKHDKTKRRGFEYKWGDGKCRESQRSGPKHKVNFSISYIHGEVAYRQYLRSEAPHWWQIYKKLIFLCFKTMPADKPQLQYKQITNTDDPVSAVFNPFVTFLYLQFLHRVSLCMLYSILQIFSHSVCGLCYFLSLLQYNFPSQMQIIWSVATKLGVLRMNNSQKQQIRLINRAPQI